MQLRALEFEHKHMLPLTTAQMLKLLEKRQLILNEMSGLKHCPDIYDILLTLRNPYSILLIIGVVLFLFYFFILMFVCIFYYLLLFVKLPVFPRYVKD